MKWTVAAAGLVGVAGVGDEEGTRRNTKSDGCCRWSRAMRPALALLSWLSSISRLLGRGEEEDASSMDRARASGATRRRREEEEPVFP